MSIEPAPIRFLVKPLITSVPYKTFTFPSNIPLSESPFFSFNPAKSNLFIGGIPKSVSRSSLIKRLGAFKGFKSLYLSDPLDEPDFKRNAWVFFDSEENFKAAEAEMNGKLSLGKGIHSTSSDSGQKEDEEMKVEVCKGGQGVLKGRYVDSMEGFSLKKHLDASEELIKAFDKEKSIEGNQVVAADQKAGKSPLFQFDLQVLYLRRVHFYCYFSGREFENQKETSAKCGVVFLHGEIKAEEEESKEAEEKKKESSWGDDLLKHTKRKIEKVKARAVSTDKLIQEFEAEKDKFLQHEIEKNKEAEGACKCKHCGKVLILFSSSILTMIIWLP